MEMNKPGPPIKHKLYIFTIYIRIEDHVHRRWIWLCTCGDWSGNDRPASYPDWNRAKYYARQHWRRQFRIRSQDA